MNVLLWVLVGYLLMGFLTVLLLRVAMHPEDRPRERWLWVLWVLAWPIVGLSLLSDLWNPFH